MAWLYSNHGQQTGPVDDATFDSLVQLGDIHDDTLVWKDGMPSWLPYSAVKPRPAQWSQDATAVLNMTPHASTPIPAYRLFNPFAVALATLFGSPLAGAFLISSNYRRTGQNGRAWAALAFGIGGTLLAIGLGYLIPSSVSTGIGIGLVLATREVARSTQGKMLEEHLQHGGRTDSAWAAFGIGLAGLAVLVGAIFAVVFTEEMLTAKPKVAFGSKDAVFYSGTATKEEATALGNALKTLGFFSDKGANVFMAKAPGSTSVTFIVKDGAWDQKDMVSAFEEIGREVAPTIGGFPVQVRLANAAQETKKEVTVGKIKLGEKDDVYFVGSATESDAKALGAALRKVGFFQDRGSSVLLTKDDGATGISFVVRDGFWEDPAHVAGFKEVIRKTAASVGGLPITMRLTDTKLEVKKEELVAK